MICGRCGAENPTEANFCRKCAKKLRKTCNCWVMKKPYDCGNEECPGHALGKQIVKEALTNYE